MKSRETFWRGFVGLCALLIVAVNPVVAQPPVHDVDAMIARMSLEHKVGQMFMVNLYGAHMTYVGRDLLETWQPGAVVLFNSNIGTPQAIAHLTNTFQQTITGAGGVPLLIAVDEEGGIVSRLHGGFTTWPVAMLLTATGNPELAYRMGQAIASELSAVGINMNLAPIADLNTNIGNPVIGRRAPGSDPAMVSLTLTQLVRGMEENGVLATLKHFPGHGDTAEDSHLSLPVVRHDRERIEAVELTPFAAGMDAGAGAVMVAHVHYTAFDPDESLPASLSYAVVTGLLRDELGYEGLAITDALDMGAISDTLTPQEAAIRAILAGIDIVAIGANLGEQAQMRAMQAVVDAVRAGRIPEARIDESVRRILETKERFGVLNWQPLDAEAVEIDLDGHAALVAELFDAGVTLVYDETGHIPIDATRSAAVVYPANRPYIRRECSMTAGGLRWLSLSDYPTGDEIRAAATLAAQVDTIVVFTRDAYYNTAQQTLVQALPPARTVVVALVSPYDWLAFPQVSAYLVTYSPLDPAITTTCGILFGAQPARGRLAVTLSDEFPAGTG